MWKFDTTAYYFVNLVLEIYMKGKEGMHIIIWVIIFINYLMSHQQHGY